MPGQFETWHPPSSVGCCRDEANRCLTATVSGEILMFLQERLEDYRRILSAE